LLALIVAGNDEVATFVTLAAHDDVDVGIVGIPMIDPDPVKFSAEIALSLRHQVSGESLAVRELLGVFW
jgi:hypothetical protein